MLDKFTQRIVDSFHRSAKQTIKPIRNALRKNANAQLDIGSKALKLGTLILIILGFVKTKDVINSSEKKEVPSTIIINNYIRDPYRKEDN